MDFSKKTLKRALGDAFETISVIISPRPLDLQTAQPVVRPSAQIASIVDYTALMDVPVLQAMVSDAEIIRCIDNLKALCPGTKFEPAAILRRQNFLLRYDKQLRDELRRHEKRVRDWARDRAEFEALMVMDQDITVLRQELKSNQSIEGRKRARISEAKQEDMELAQFEELKVPIELKVPVELKVPCEDSKEVKVPYVSIIRELEKPQAERGRRPRGKENRRTRDRHSKPEKQPKKLKKPKEPKKSKQPTPKPTCSGGVKRGPKDEEDTDDDDEGAESLEELLAEVNLA